MKYYYYFLDKCDFTSEEFKDLKAHRNDEHGEKWPILPISKFVDENNKTVDSKLPDGAKKHPTLGIEKIKCAFCEVSMHSASNLKMHLKTKHPGVKWLGYACGKFRYLT